MNKKITKMVFIIWVLLSLIAIVFSLWQMILDIKNYQYVYGLYLGIIPDNSLDKTLNQSLQDMLRSIFIFSSSLLSLLTGIALVIGSTLLLKKVNQIKVTQTENQLEELKKSE